MHEISNSEHNNNERSRSSHRDRKIDFVTKQGLDLRSLQNRGSQTFWNYLPCLRSDLWYRADFEKAIDQEIKKYCDRFTKYTDLLRQKNLIDEAMQNNIKEKIENIRQEARNTLEKGAKASKPEDKDNFYRKLDEIYYKELKEIAENLSWYSMKQEGSLTGGELIAQEVKNLENQNKQIKDLRNLVSEEEKQQIENLESAHISAVQRIIKGEFIKGFEDLKQYEHGCEQLLRNLIRQKTQNIADQNKRIEDLKDLMNKEEMEQIEKDLDEIFQSKYTLAAKQIEEGNFKNGFEMLEKHEDERKNIECFWMKKITNELLKSMEQTIQKFENNQKAEFNEEINSIKDEAQKTEEAVKANATNELEMLQKLKDNTDQIAAKVANILSDRTKEWNGKLLDAVDDNEHDYEYDEQEAFKDEIKKITNNIRKEALEQLNKGNYRYALELLQRCEEKYIKIENDLY